MDTTITKSNVKLLNAQQIKTIAIIAMLIDHIAGSFVNGNSPLGITMHVIGRITAPVMCFFIAEGYLHTRSFKKYLSRLCIFALISHIPYVYRSLGRVTIFPFSVMYTLALGLIAIYAYDKIKNRLLKWITIVFICLLALPGDWMFLGIIFCLIFYINRNNFRNQCIGITLIGTLEVVLFIIFYLVNNIPMENVLHSVLYQLGIILCLPILYLYNGEKGGTSSTNRFTGLFFYIFYPLHLLILGIIKHVIL